MKRRAWVINKKGNWRIEYKISGLSFYLADPTGSYIEFRSKDAAEDYIRDHNILEFVG